MKPVKVYSCAKRFQADMLIEALNEEGIPAYSQTDGSGEYMEIYMGTSLFGEDIYVDESDAARAEEIIKGMTLPADDTQQTAESDEPAAVSEGNRMSAAKIICLIAAILFILAAVVPSIAGIING
ncbi:MAG TPA: DUF2007 domain-containing protein [Candidatus Mediterraneibacter faecigallinarum]|uniref:DUF2007 domain-containing protein n=1 Tax=Candidatus Mediterraneibacter faecigallinarum TaxID=2838669 RepID=A0A9D2NSI8_9FIRM|nr:DUF2007 domain-containing protein [Candidatus Mediterraneibacter faecigallinarum]